MSSRRITNTEQQTAPHHLLQHNNNMATHWSNKNQMTLLKTNDPHCESCSLQYLKVVKESQQFFTIKILQNTSVFTNQMTVSIETYDSNFVSLLKVRTQWQPIRTTRLTVDDSKSSLVEEPQSSVLEGPDREHSDCQQEGVEQQIQTVELV